MGAIYGTEGELLCHLAKGKCLLNVGGLAEACKPSGCRPDRSPLGLQPEPKHV